MAAHKSFVCSFLFSIKNMLYSQIILEKNNDSDIMNDVKWFLKLLQKENETLLILLAVWHKDVTIL